MPPKRARPQVSLGNHSGTDVQTRPDRVSLRHSSRTAMHDRSLRSRQLGYEATDHERSVAVWQLTLTSPALGVLTQMSLSGELGGPTESTDQCGPGEADDGRRAGQDGGDRYERQHEHDEITSRCLWSRERAPWQ